MEHTTETTPSFWSRLGSLSLLGVAFLVPLFIIPSDVVPFQFSKVLITFILTFLALVSFFVVTLKSKKFSTTFHPVMIVLYTLPIAYGISTLFSHDTRASLMGYQFATDTFAFMLLGVALAHTTVLVFTDRVKIFSVLVALLIGSWVVYVFQGVQFLFNGPFPLSLLTDPASNLIGKWNDLAMYAGFIGALTLLARESLVLSKLHRLLLSVTLGASLFILAVVHMFEAWLLFGVAALSVLVLAFVRRFMSRKSDEQTPASQGVSAGVATVLTTLFLLGGSLFAPLLQQVFSISAVEVRPSYQSTADIFRSVYAESPIVGTGPNTFAASWLKFRSPSIAQTEFWNALFPAGSSTLITAATTGGVVILLAWLAVIVVLLVSVVRALFRVEAHNRQSYFITSISALGVLYLLFAHLMYTPSQGLTVLFFLFAGLFVASLNHTPLVRTLSFTIGEAPRATFAFVLGGFVVLVFGLSALYATGRVYASSIIHNYAVQVAQGGDTDRALSLIARATELDAQDRYFRSAAFIYIDRIDSLIRGGQSDEVTQEAFQNAVAGAIQSTGQALAQNGTRFENLMARALVYAQVVPLGVKGALENGVVTYEEARKSNPYDPEIDWRLAQMYVATGNTESALEAIAMALSKKADYTPAILLRAQIALNSGNLEEAITSVKNAVYFEPNNEILLYQLGILLLQDESYADAALAFELSLQQRPDFANATFFLAQAYAFLERFDEAGTLISQLSEKNPDQSELQEYLDELGRGVNPFATSLTAPEEEEVIGEEVVE